MLVVIHGMTKIMCTRPNTLPNGLTVACHECWQCRERAINDWVGRCIAESKTAAATFAVTLTYGRNSADDVIHERSVILTYSDVQKYLKRLRFDGYKVRYLVTGEFGSKFARAHWHIVLFFEDKVPEIQLNQKQWMQEHWPHGYSFWTTASPHALRYNVKYIQKEMGDDLKQGHLAMSKKPPLGYAYFCQLAERYVSQGLAPQTLEYKFPDVRWKKTGQGPVVPYRLTGRTAELFLQHYIDTWRATHGNDNWPASDLVHLFSEYGRVVSDENLLSERVVGMVRNVKRFEPVTVQHVEQARARVGKRDESDVWADYYDVKYGKQDNGKEEQQERQGVHREHVRAWVFWYFEERAQSFHVSKSADEYVEEYLHGARPDTGGV